MNMHEIADIDISHSRAVNENQFALKSIAAPTHHILLLLIYRFAV